MTTCHGAGLPHWVHAGVPQLALEVALAVMHNGNTSPTPWRDKLLLESLTVL